MSRVIHALFWLGLLLWVSALVTAGIAAMNVFGTLPGLDLTVDRYPAVPPEEHGTLAASHVMERVFFTIDMLQFVAIPLVLVTLLLELVRRGAARRPANLVRAACLVVAAGLFAYHAFAVAPTMNRALRDRWTAAAAADLTAAEEHRARFNELHPIADTVLRVNLGLVLLGAIASAVASAPRPAPTDPSVPEAPRLASGSRA